ncbi:hypothetical protein Niako_0869 [Niastella koreensis GR20-10]|uniref:Polyketide cyclase/dehydrase n=1 Tax=Niastella koreensis (strain DSM 17620 / KACC 11465 / NBRC 106392 / GR20-10) TaxID=700598 RepID=G8TE57_NIAKG|nr:hypothetical protein Niako_0869 [Niastella koreensis GR20-10]
MKNFKVKKLLICFLSLIIILVISVIMLESFSTYKVSKTIHLDAPVITKKSITINAPIEKVWTIFTDVHRKIISKKNRSLQIVGFEGPFRQLLSYKTPGDPFIVLRQP